MIIYDDGGRPGGRGKQQYGARPGRGFDQLAPGARIDNRHGRFSLGYTARAKCTGAQ